MTGKIVPLKSRLFKYRYRFETNFSPWQLKSPKRKFSNVICPVGISQ